MALVIDAASSGSASYAENTASEVRAAVEVPTRPCCHPHASSSQTTTRGALLLPKSVSTHICDDGCFDFVDVGGGVQQLKCRQDLVAIHTQAYVGLDEQ
eukprot:scaffold6741_cov69-Skeletonema_dohrnii-CCMP3373.AAC.4